MREISKARFRRSARLTHMNLTRQLHANSREWFQTSNLIQSRQIQNKEKHRSQSQ